MRGWAVLVLVAGGCATAPGPVPGVVAERQRPALACPLDHAPVEVPSVLLGEQTGVRLDLRPLGQGTLLLPLARCGRCGLVFVPEREETPEALEALRRAVASSGFRAARSSPSDRLARAVLLEEAGAAVEARARAWLEAAWELEGVDEPRRRQSLERALAAFREVGATAPRKTARALRWMGESQGDEARTAAFLQVELLRQLSRFEEASSALEALAARPEFSRAAYAKLVPLERALVEARDALPRPIPPLGPIDWQDDDDDAVLAARALRGWATFTTEFTLERADTGNLDSEPEALRVTVEARGRGSIDQARWWNPVDEQHRPRLHWGDFLRLYRSAEGVVARHPWMAAWREAYPERRVELEAVGVSPWSSGLQREALPRWHHSGLPGAPAVQLQLTYRGRRCADVYLDAAGEAGLVLRDLGCPGEIWPLHLSPGGYLLVRADGRWEQATLPSAPAPAGGEVAR